MTRSLMMRSIVVMARLSSNGEGDVVEHGREDSSLRGAGDRCRVAAVLTEDARTQERGKSHVRFGGADRGNSRPSPADWLGLLCSAGDDVLRVMGDCLRRAARSGDCVARYGGEFAAVLAQAGNEGASSFLRRLRLLWA